MDKYFLFLFWLERRSVLELRLTKVSVTMSCREMQRGSFTVSLFLSHYSSVHEEIDFAQSIGFACGFWLEHKRSLEKPRTHY